jgi:hypothetical protein
MAPVEYRHEYVSGVVTVVGFPAAISARLANRGATDGIARVLVRAGGGVVLDSMGGVDSSNGLVKAGDIWIFEADLPIGIDVKAVSYSVQIRTTSPELIPSLAFQETVWSDGKAQGLRESAYFAPGDFAVFPLHLSPLDPPPHVEPPNVATNP